MNAESSKLDKLRSNHHAVTLYCIVASTASCLLKFAMAGFWTVLLYGAVLVLLSDPHTTTVGDVHRVLLNPVSIWVFIIGGAAGFIYRPGVQGRRGIAAISKGTSA